MRPGLAAVVALLLAVPARAQDEPAAEPPASPPARAAAEETAPPSLPDLEIHAVVRIDELTFEEVPRVSVALPGTPGRTVVDHADRENLPTPVQPGVVYRDVVIRLTISSTFPVPL